MKLPRDVGSRRLIKALEQAGYVVIRQRGSHVRVKHAGPPEHSITIPMHDPLKMGTLHGILSEVARARKIPMEGLVELL
jgi:predicted RNA binding protein YcfA (HicA-like mRNA interferase family)